MDALAGPARRLPVDTVELAWDVAGELTGGAVPLVLVHGYTGSSHDFALHVEALAAERPVVVVDHRGHGLSTNTGVEADYTVERLVADLAALVDSAVGRPVHLLGHSMGGRVALRLALARPDLVASLVAMDTTAWSFGLDDDQQSRSSYLSTLPLAFSGRRRRPRRGGAPCSWPSARGTRR
jgi:pimeloyl-ACP methyl ester carboxylesterase